MHEPVMVDAVLRCLAPRAGARLLDATVGSAGHACALLDASAPDGRLWGLDRDAAAVAAAGERLRPYGNRVTLAHQNFEALAEGPAGPWDAVLFDLGMGSHQLDDASRGFSFQTPGPLDMRFDLSEPLTASRLVEAWEEDELEAVFAVLGDEPQARRVARRVVGARAQGGFRNTGELAAAVRSAAGPAGVRRVFQAMRMAVNRELWCLQEGVSAALRALAPGGRLAVLSFHSGEDRVVKRLFREAVRRGEVRWIIETPERPAADEQRRNRRSRSALLRAVCRFSAS